VLPVCPTGFNNTGACWQTCTKEQLKKF